MTLAAHTAQEVTLITASPPLQVTALRGVDPPTITGGYGGYTTVARPRKKSLVEWDGIEPYEMSLPMIFDGYTDDESVELPIGRLEQMAGAARAQFGEPPLIQIIGAVPQSDLTWVVKGLEWGDPVIWDEDGFRTRQGVTLDLLEYVAPDRLHAQGAAEEARLKHLDERAAAVRRSGVGGAIPAHASTYIVVAGDTLSSIAAKQLGDYRRWVEIAELNDLRDPRRLKINQLLRLP